MEEPVPPGRAAWRLLLASVFSFANKEWVEQLGAGGGRGSFQFTLTHLTIWIYLWMHPKSFLC